MTMFSRMAAILNQKSTPWGIILFFALLASTVLAFHLPENITAVLYLSFFFLIASLNPINAMAFLLLSIPFFLGASHKPYFFLFEILVYGTLVLGFFHLWKNKISVVIPFKPLVLLLVSATLFSIPINAKEYYYEFWATPFREIWFQWLSGHEKFPLFHLRALSNMLSGILLFILTANLFSKKCLNDLEKPIRGLIWVASIICAIGVLFLFNLLPSQQKTYLSLSLAGIHEGAVSAFAFNRQYLAQFLLILFPFLFYLLYVNRRKTPLCTTYLLLLVLFALILSSTMQRSAYLVFFLEMFLFTLFCAFLFSSRKKTVFIFLLMPFLLLAVMLLMDYLVFQGRFLDRWSLWGLSDPSDRRIHLWTTAWRMFTFSPFLGVGLGKFHNLFPEFYKSNIEVWSTYRFVRGEPHSFYLQTLAEQGIIGFLLLLSLGATVVYGAVKKTKEETSNEGKLLSLVLLISLFGWFLLGFFHNVSYVRSLGVLFWILLGWSVGLTAARAIPGNKFFWVGFTVLLLALGYQIKIISDRPLSPFFQTGLYDKEILPGGEKFRWTGKRAVFQHLIEGKQVKFTLSAPLPGINEHPQKIRFRIEEKDHEVILKDPGWQKISFPVKESSGKEMLVRLETEYTFNPKKAKISKDDRDLGIMIQEK